MILTVLVSLGILTPQVGALVGPTTAPTTLRSDGGQAPDASAVAEGSQGLPEATSSGPAPEASIPIVTPKVTENPATESGAEPASESGSDTTEAPAVQLEVPGSSELAPAGADVSGENADPSGGDEAQTLELPTREASTRVVEGPDSPEPVAPEPVAPEPVSPEPTRVNPVDPIALLPPPTPPLLCPFPGTLSAPASVGGNGRVHISSLASGTLPGSAGTADIIVNVDTTALPNKGIFDMQAIFAHSSANTAGLNETQVGLYCYAEDAAKANPTRGYARFPANWGGSDGAWTGIAVQLRPNAPTNLSSYAGDRITVVAGDSVYSGGELIKAAAGVRLDEHLVSTILDKFKSNLHSLLWSLINQQLAGKDYHLRKLEFDADLNVTFSSSGANGAVVIHASMANVLAEAVPDDPPWLCPNVYLKINFDNNATLIGDATLSITGNGSSGFSVTPSSSFSDVDLDLSIKKEGVCSIVLLFQDLVHFLSGGFLWQNGGYHGVNNNESAFEAVFETLPELFQDKVATPLNAALSGVAGALPGPLTLDRLESDGAGLIAVFDLTLPSGISVIKPSGPSPNIDEVIHDRFIGSTPIDVAAYISGEGLAIAGSLVLAPATGNTFPGPYVDYSASGDMAITWPDYRFSLGGGAFNQGVIDLRGYGKPSIAWNPTAHKYGVVVAHPPGDCTTNSAGSATDCPALSLWEAPANFNGGAVGAGLWNQTMNVWSMIIPPIPNLPWPIPFTFRFLTGQVSGAEGYFGIYGHLIAPPGGNIATMLGPPPGIWDPEWVELTAQPNSSVSQPVQSVAWSGTCTLFMAGSPNNGTTLTLNIASTGLSALVDLPSTPSGGNSAEPPWWDCDVTALVTDANGFQVTLSTTFGFGPHP